MIQGTGDVVGRLVAENDELQAEVRRLRAALTVIGNMHRKVDDDPGGPPYCPECVAYDGNPNPCPTSAIARHGLGVVEVSS